MDLPAESTRYIVGLGNPGRRYAKTRHNVGWMALAALRRRWAIGDGRAAFSGMMYEARLADQAASRVVLFEPQLYMNRSGEAVNGLISFYKADSRNVLVVLDDMALPLGRLRARANGSAGGHNGLKDILRHLGTDEVSRVRIGIGASPEQMDSADYVLAKFADEEIETVATTIERAADAVEDWIAKDIRYVMDNYNRPPEQ